MKKVMLMAAVLIFQAVAGPVFAADVYVTKQGKKYHSAACPFLKNKETSAIPEEKAVERKMKPCSKCLSPDTPKKLPKK
ncbi:MAG: hypothetical protein Q8Q08_11885 [Candidatus Omnitrophota bacterium]|nr:hypothetical protein [Candidatus Omnitrophota bacterium]